MKVGKCVWNVRYSNTPAILTQGIISFLEGRELVKSGHVKTTSRNSVVINQRLGCGSAVMSGYEDRPTEIKKLGSHKDSDVISCYQIE